MFRGVTKASVCVLVAGIVVLGVTPALVAAHVDRTPGRPLPPRSMTHQKGIVPPRRPRRSLAPFPDFPRRSSCVNGGNSKTCNTLVLQAVAHARKELENIKGMSFSLRTYEHLRPIVQLFATVNIERIERGLGPVAELVRSLNRVAQQGAVKNEDPPLNQVPSTLPGGATVINEGANWSTGFDNPLGSDYGWMYDDGPKSVNGSCTTPKSPGCWGHRQNILDVYATEQGCAGGSVETVMGAGYLKRGGQYGDSETELIVGACGRMPTDAVATWKKLKRQLRAH